MKRDIYKKLQAWKISLKRKPLLLQGARQTGKTYLLKEFGLREYKNVVYCNFEEDPLLDNFFQQDLNPDRILADFSIYYNVKIVQDDVLLIFDEIQVSNNALNSLKYFAEKKPDIHIVAAGSLLGIKMSRPGSFPVGKVNFLNLYPMSFLEYLDAMGESRYRQMLENIIELNPIAEAFHSYLINLLKKYYFTGGMPEAVKHFVETADGQEVREIQEEIIKSYLLDFAKHASTADIPKLSKIWESIPAHLARENKKFIFSAIKKGARARSYESAIIWLEDAGLIIRSFAVEKSDFPLKYYTKNEIFKVYVLDVGLLGAMAKTPVKMLVSGERLFNEYEGAFVENYVAQQLLSSMNNQSLYYWRSKGGKAELDFLCEINEKICPLEVKAGINPKSKSLKSYDTQFAPDLLARTTLLNFKKDGKILNVPLYAINFLQKLKKI